MSHLHFFCFQKFSESGNTNPMNKKKKKIKNDDSIDKIEKIIEDTKAETSALKKILKSLDKNTNQK